MGTQESITPVYGKNERGRRVLIGMKHGGRTEVQIANGTFPDKYVAPDKKYGFTVPEKSEPKESTKESTKPKRKRFSYKRRNSSD